jgi:hypothetical protein
MSNKSKYALAAIIALGMNPLAISTFAYADGPDLGTTLSSTRDSGQTYNYMQGAPENLLGRVEESRKTTAAVIGDAFDKYDELTDRGRFGEGWLR